MTPKPRKEHLRECEATVLELREQLLDVASVLAPDLYDKWLGPCVGRPEELEGLCLELLQRLGAEVQAARAMRDSVDIFNVNETVNTASAYLLLSLLSAYDKARRGE